MKLTSPQRRRLNEDYHGGETSPSQFPTDTLERSQSRKGSPDVYVHQKDGGQAGVPKHDKRKKKSNVS